MVTNGFVVLAAGAVAREVTSDPSVRASTDLHNWRNVGPKCFSFISLFSLVPFFLSLVKQASSNRPHQQIASQLQAGPETDRLNLKGAHAEDGWSDYQRTYFDFYYYSFSLFPFSPFPLQL